jgi:hypothetical protein
MASGLSQYLRGKLLDHAFGGTTYTPPSNTHVRLYTTMPDSAGSGGTEVSTSNWTNYAVVSQTNNTTNWPNATGTTTKEKSNGTLIDFGTAATTGNVNVAGYAIWDAASGGNMLAFCGYASAVVVQNGQPASIPVGDLDIRLTETA